MAQVLVIDHPWHQVVRGDMADVLVSAPLVKP
jgi:hypothetical protein